MLQPFKNRIHSGLCCVRAGEVCTQRCSLRGVSCADVVEALGSQHVLSTPSSLYMPVNRQLLLRAGTKVPDCSH